MEKKVLFATIFIPFRPSNMLCCVVYLMCFAWCQIVSNIKRKTQRCFCWCELLSTWPNRLRPMVYKKYMHGTLSLYNSNKWILLCQNNKGNLSTRITYLRKNILILLSIPGILIRIVLASSWTISSLLFPDPCAVDRGCTSSIVVIKVFVSLRCNKEARSESYTDVFNLSWNHQHQQHRVPLMACHMESIFRKTCSK